ncbi:MAG: UDP-3-O-[3-hydroxymyristoyl] N-acetylglucosamine deacetylase [Deltaproteobacteria bacterium]|nr:UDP-3-O-[3-hydroxymyristoyl] N-acetylglucosamine deacetylase [Deltaproteobacteria bacterium]
MATVLLVDDEPQIRTSLRGILAEEGLRVLEAEDGAQALDVIRRERPELVILDIWMPEMDGLQLLQHINDGSLPPAVIMISGHGNIETAVMATKLGAFDFIEKPFSLDGLLRTVNRALDHQAATQRRSGNGAADVNAIVETPAAVESTGAVVGPSKLWSERTIAKSVVASGLGLHSGGKTGLILQPLPAGSGIQFTSLSTEATVPAHLDWVDSTGYATTLHRDGVTARTIEHLMATLHAYRITNLLVKVQGEVPILDGSALELCRLIESAGVADQGGRVEEIVIHEPIAVGKEGGERIAIEPYDGFGIAYTLRYPHPVGVQQHTYLHRGPESFRDEVAPARTFGFLKDMKQLTAMGLASGGRLDNFILIDDEKVVNTQLRFPDELARHKILDIMGDTYLLGRPLRGMITANMTGHSDNISLLREVRRQMRL